MSVQDLYNATVDEHKSKSNAVDEGRPVYMCVNTDDLDGVKRLLDGHGCDISSWGWRPRVDMRGRRVVIVSRADDDV